MNYNRLLKSPSEFLDEWQVEYQNKGKELLAKCAFGSCDEKSDSYHLYVNAETGQYKCMKCGSKGNLITLAKQLGQDTKSIYENERKAKPKKVPEAPATSIEPVTDRREQARNLNKDLSVDHRRYLNARGLSDETIDTYLIGETGLKDPESGEMLRRITIPVFDKLGQVLFFKARIAPELEDCTTAKYIYYPSGSAALYGIETLASSQNDFVVITEGEFDCLVLRQLGYTAVSSTGGCGTFPEEWVRYFDKFSKIYLCFDNDTPGQQATITHARKFGSKDVYFIDIPAISGVKDISEYFLTNKTKTDFEELLSNARKFDPESFEYSGLELTDPQREFIPAQYFTPDGAYLTFKLSYKKFADKGQDIFVVSSDRKLASLEIFTSKTNLVVARAPDFEQRWSNDGLETFLRGKEVKPDYNALLNDTISFLKEFLDLGTDDWYLVVALWIWGTYFYRLYKSYPYFNINGLMGCGKSKMLELCSFLSFNGRFLMGSTPAFIIRAISDNCATVFIDEAENLKGDKSPETQTLIQMLNAGYKIGPKIGKMDVGAGGKGWKGKEYDPYSPKMIAGINNVSDTLISRSINLTLLASENGEIKNKEADNDNPKLTLLRSRYYLSVMSLFKEVKKVYLEMRELEITGRNWEVWRPLLGLALVLDGQRNDGETTIYNQIRNFALERVRVTSAIAEDTQTHVTLLLALKQMMEENGRQEGFYPVNNLKTYLTTFHPDEFGWLADSKSGGGKYIGNTLRKTGVVEGGSRVERIEGKPVRGYDLKLEIINGRLKALGVVSKV